MHVIRNWRLATKVLVGVLLVLSFAFTGMMTILSANERGVFEAQLTGKGENLARLVASISLDPILSYNFDYLESYAKELGKDPDAAYVVVLDREGKPLTRAFAEPADKTGIRPFAADVKQGDEVVGSVRIGLRTRAIEEGVRRSKVLVLGLGLGAMLVVSGLVVLLFRAVVLRGVQSLRDNLGRVAEGDIGVEIEVLGKDELALLHESLARMVERLRGVVGEV
jgi:methyl-accepting chemotaxis protein